MNSTISDSFCTVENVLKLTYIEMKVDIAKRFNGEQFNELINIHMETSYKYLQRTILSELFNADAALEAMKTSNAVPSTDSPAMLSFQRLPVNEWMCKYFSIIEKVLWMAFYELEIKLVGEIRGEQYVEFLKRHLLPCFSHVHRAIVNELRNMDAIVESYIENNDTTAEVLVTQPHSHVMQPPIKKKKKNYHKQVTCNVCNKEMRDNNLKRHMKTHVKQM